MSTQSATGAMSSSGLPYYSWEPADKLIAVHLYFDVIDRIIPEVMRGFTSLPRRGAEVGGLLLGRITPGFKVEVTVEDVEFVPSEYLSGPSYHLSGKDLKGLEEAILRRKADDSLAVVGCFRSHTRKDLFLDDQDVNIFAQYFSAPGNVFLLIKPYATRASTAGFFFWEDGEVQRDACCQEFPFGRRELGGGDPRAAMRQRAEPMQPRHAAPLAERPLPQLERHAPAPDDLSPPTPEPVAARAGSRLSILSAAEPAAAFPPATASRWRWLWVPALLLLAAIGGYLGLQFSKTSSLQSSAGGGPLPLKLALYENQTQLEVVWDRAAQAITGARSGLLTIQDGNFRRDIELSPPELRDGRVRYSRITSDVTVRLEVTSPRGQTQSESIRLLAKEPAPPVTAEMPAVTPPAEPPKAAPREIAAPPQAVSAPKPSEPKPESPLAARASDEPKPAPRKKAAAAKPPKPETAEPAPAAAEPAPEPAIDIRPGRRR